MFYLILLLVEMLTSLLKYYFVFYKKLVDYMNFKVCQRTQSYDEQSAQLHFLESGQTVVLS